MENIENIATIENLKTMKNSKFVDLTPYCQPGIYLIYCKATGRAFFGEGSELFFDLKDFYENLKCGICDNENLLKDFQTFGIDDFSYFIVVVGLEFRDLEKRKSRLEEEKSNWPLELY